MKLIIIILIILGLIIVCGLVTFTNTNSGISEKSGDKLVIDNETKSINRGNYATNESDTNTILVKNGGKLDISDVSIYKEGSSESTQAQPPEAMGGGSGEGGAPPSEGGAPPNNGGAPPGEGNSGPGGDKPPEQGGTSNTEDSEFYGTNAAVLTLYDSVTNISNCKIETNANGANAIFSTNNDSSHSGSTTYVKDVEISTYQDKSRGLDATYGGIIIADNVKINTRGGSCAALATDRGEGTVNVTNSELNTGVNKSNGAGSPCIYSTGSISVTNSTGTANVAQIACIEGKNSINLNNCDLTGYAQGNRQSNGEYVDLGGVFLYQSMSGDASEGTATFNSQDSKLSIASDSEYYNKAPMFHVTNTQASINLDNTELSFGSNILLNVSGQDQWGTNGANGGITQFTVNNEKLTGDIIIDSISSLNFNLKNSNYSGCINPSDSFGNTNITIETGSTWTLTGNSHINGLNNQGTIEYGDYTLYVNGQAYTASNPYKG